MKNISLVLNAVLILAVIVLFYLHFSSSKPKTSGGHSKSKNQNIAMAYVNSDSLFKKYSLAEVMRKEMIDKKNKMENEYGAQARTLETEISAFQKNAPAMSPNEAKATEENLMMKRQRLMQYQEQLTQQLVQEESRLNDSLYNKISSHIRDYGKQNNLDFVLGYSRGSNIFYAQDSLEITTEILKGLNDKFNEKATK